MLEEGAARWRLADLLMLLELITDRGHSLGCEACPNKVVFVRIECASCHSTFVSIQSVKRVAAVRLLDLLHKAHNFLVKVHFFNLLLTRAHRTRAEVIVSVQLWPSHIFIDMAACLLQVVLRGEADVCAFIVQRWEVLVYPFVCAGAVDSKTLQWHLAAFGTEQLCSLDFSFSSRARAAQELPLEQVPQMALVGVVCQPLLFNVPSVTGLGELTLRC